MHGRPRPTLVAAGVLILWAVSAVAGLAVTLDAAAHGHGAGHRADGLCVLLL